MNKHAFEKDVSDIFSVLGNPFRIQLLYSIGTGEACVCHLEAVLKKRQAYISQHLGVMRDAGILETRRDGKYIFYRIANAGVFDLVQMAANFQNIPEDKIPEFGDPEVKTNCICPHCEGETIPAS